MPHLLSKSKYIRGLQCSRALWLDVHNPSVGRYTKEQMRRFTAGRDFEYHFKDTFPDGVDISLMQGRDVDQYPFETSCWLDNEVEVVLFEAGFQYGDVLVLADVVRKCASGGLEIFEVKSGIELTDTYRRDAALQHYVISHCREVRSFSLVHNDGKGGFVITDLTEELQSEHPLIERRLDEMREVVYSLAEPSIPTGAHCLNPYACPYQHHCQQDAVQLTLFA